MNMNVLPVLVALLGWVEPPPLDKAGVPLPVRRGGLVATFERNKTTGRVDCWFREDIHPGHIPALLTVKDLGVVTISGSRDAPARPTDESLRLLRLVPARGITVTGPITDTGLAHLAGHKQLQSLHLLMCPGVTAAGLKTVHTLPALTEFRASLMDITDEGLAVVARHPGITSIGLAHCPEVTNAGLLAVAAPGRLRTLMLASNARLTGAGLAAACERLPELEYLYFARISLTWEQAAVIIRLPRLKTLILGAANGEGEGGARLSQWWTQRQAQQEARQRQPKD
jgi:hypothetical protein